MVMVLLLLLRLWLVVVVRASKLLLGREEGILLVMLLSLLLPEGIQRLLGRFEWSSRRWARGQEVGRNVCWRLQLLVCWRHQRRRLMMGCSWRVTLSHWCGGRRRIEQTVRGWRKRAHLRPLVQECRMRGWWRRRRRRWIVGSWRREERTLCRGRGGTYSGPSGRERRCRRRSERMSLAEREQIVDQR